MSDEVLVETDGRVMVVTLNRPEAKNAVDAALASQMEAAFDNFDADDALSVAVITGAGPTFCAGMDLKAFARGEPPPRTPHRGFAGLVAKPPDKPLIAAVEGHAVAGGFEIALACDIIVASETAVFALPEVKRGLVASGGGLLRLPERIPYQQALRLLLTGDDLPANRAFDLGLVDQVTPTGEALAAARALAMRIAANAPLALEATKRIVTSARTWTPEERFARQSAITEPIIASADAAEGARAFAEKRAPVWRRA